MKYYDLNEFLRLSALLNYQLSAKFLDWHNIMHIILGEKTLSSNERVVLIQVFDYLSHIYGQQKRKLGPLKVLHPLRATALLSRSTHNISLLDIITELLHDNFEDNKPNEFRVSTWFNMDNRFKQFLKQLDENEHNALLERLDGLTKRPQETYYQYIGRMLKHEDIIHVKLADRLDNTLDMRIIFEDPIGGTDFFENIFQLLFNNTYKGYQPKSPHPIYSTFNGAERLYQLFKNIVLISLIRKDHATHQENTAHDLIHSLAKASMQEAQRIVLHIFGYHETEIKKIRSLITETMEYVQKGGINVVTSPMQRSPLDGILISRFDDSDKEIRKKKLDQLYQEKPLMVQVAIAFIVIFLNFMNDPHYYVRGISEQGVVPEDS